MVNSTRSSGGSSPLARGLLRVPVMLDDSFGIIPARAGFTRGLGGSGVHLGDHPRSRGVYNHIPCIQIKRSGSSPLARGLLDGHGGNIRRTRIIPARAGFTIWMTGAASRSQDHPRSRGVYFLGRFFTTFYPGSSPLARGLHARRLAELDRTRIIPARAGFTRTLNQMANDQRDHPRSRGVYSCGSLESQRTRTLPDPCCLHCRPRVRSAELR